ncbi:potassium channel family protein [Gallaecimonas sp. GXIMD1310]|uniref:potassium channel family protein n=1 Tax=Gallaecimonas sp. GXIMD1310 TaxID=3131926 RepID=UPI0032527241
MNSQLRVLAPTPIELAMMVLSLLAVLVVLALQFAPLRPDERELLIYLDTSICVIFLSRFVIGLVRATHKWEFVRSHWIDVVASIPMVDVLRYGRLFQVIRVLRILRMANHVIRQLMHQSANAVFAIMLLTLVLVVGGSSIAILLAESGQPGSNIHTAEDAIWWALVTISTVGYGDYYPVTTAGRVITGFVIVAGVSLFGGVSGLIASRLLHSREDEDRRQRSLHNQLASLEQQVVQLQNQLTLLSNQLTAKTATAPDTTDETAPSPSAATDAYE